MKGVEFVSMEVLLRNYSECNKYMIWNGYTYNTIDKLDRSEQGIVGYTENKELVGIFIRNSEVFFLNNNKEYKIDATNFICSNPYIDKNTRHFKLENHNVTIYELIYEPYIDPGMLIYDADLEEFDFLLFINNNILQNKETLENFIISTEKLI
jgi:hypothetical protein